MKILGDERVQHPLVSRSPAEVVREASENKKFSRRAALLGCGALAACAAPESGVVVTAPLPPAAPPPPEDDLTLLRDGANPVVAGEVLEGPLLRAFYRRRGFTPVWTDRPALADAAAAAVLRAHEHGLDPEMFHAPLLARRAMFPELRRELLLSHAVLTYARALATGGVVPARRTDNEALLADPVDVAAVLDAALDGPNPLARIEALAPDTPNYRVLREALRRHRAGEAAPAERLRHIEANLERERWLPRRLPAERVWVNVADQRLVLFREEGPAFTSRVAVGAVTDHKQSPEFSALITGAFFNPPWIIPSDIVQNYILPRLAREPGFLTRSNITLLPNGDAEQAPGPTAGLGVILFDMPNRFDVFLHDTPNRDAFDGQNRRISNGCIRVDNPLELASLLMDKPMPAIRATVARGETVRKPMDEPVPVFIVYQTAFASAEGALQFRPDFYNRDASLAERLRRRSLVRA